MAVPLVVILAAVAAIILSCGFVIKQIGWYKSLTNEELEIIAETSLREEQLNSCGELYDIGTEEYHNCITDIELEIPEEGIIDSLVSSVADALGMSLKNAKLIVYAGIALLAIMLLSSMSG